MGARDPEQLEAEAARLREQVEALQREVDDLRRAQEARREAGARLQELTDLLPAIVFELDARGVLTYTNKQAYAITGYCPEDLGRGFDGMRLFVPRDRERVRSNIRKVLRGEEVANREYTARRKDGTEFPALARSVRIVRDGQAVGIRGVIIDISEQRRAERQLREAEQRLREAQKAEAVGQLAGGIAHDINNLLGTIMGLASVMRRELGADDPMLEDVETILGACSQGNELTHNLLGFARKRAPARCRVDLNQLVGVVCRLVEGAISHGIVVEQRLDPELVPLAGDPVELEQVLVNLALNASDAIADRGSLVFATRNVELAAERPRGLAAGRHVQLEVRDDGAGMDAETMSHAFDPFFTTKPTGKGTGLGLSMVHSTVRNHGGTVSLDSEPGRGTTVTILLPVERPVDGVAEEHDGAAPALAGRAVLLVDDEPLIRSSGRRLLENLGFRVLLAENGRAALDRYAAHASEIALVVLDLIMPVMDGAETFRELRKLDPDVLVLLSSGYVKESKAEALISAGAAGFLRKPYTMEQLSRYIDQALEGRGGTLRRQPTDRGGGSPSSC